MAEPVIATVQRRMRPLLGTFVEIAALSSTDASSAIEAAFACIENVQARLSFQDMNSELSQLNRSQGDWVALSSLTLRVLRLAKIVGEKGGELFNATVGGALVERGLLPDHSGRDVLLAGVSSDIDIAATHARLKRPVLITLDGIAKGYAVDLAVQALRKCGVISGWVNAGGDARAFGGASLHMQRRELDGNLTSIGLLKHAAIASSRTHADALSGYTSEMIHATTAPIANSIVTVVAATAWRADALTKVAALLPREQHSMLSHLGGRIVSPSRPLFA